MAQQYTANSELCATCEFWGGQRTFFNRLQDRIVLESATIKGRCLNRQSGRFTDSSGTQACYKCRYYQTWALLKK